MNNRNILLYCRPGFEKECAAEIMAVCTSEQVYGYIKSKPDSGYVLFVNQAEDTTENLNRRLAFNRLVFARQMLFVDDIRAGLPQEDRISPLLETIQGIGQRFRELRLESPDTNDGKQLSAFCKKFTSPLTRALEQKERLDTDSPWRLHLFFLNSATVYAGVSHIGNSSPLPGGIRRLKMPRSAPSRSTLKLEEALLTLLDESERRHQLCNGMTAVDLGACPGGWTWQLVQRGIRVDAIDNGDMDAALMDTGLVRHIRADGFRYRPDKPVDWLVCDMVERPLHITRLIARWLTEGLCRHTVFNLKLPMKQRYPTVVECRELIEAELAAADIDFELRMKQLYHDREEITCVVLTKENANEREKRK